MESMVADEILNGDGKNDLKAIIQLKFFDDVTEEDIRKTIWLLSSYVSWIDIIKNYEFAMKEMENGMSQYDLLCAEGSVAKRITGQELIADVTANAVILKDERHIYYKLYVAVTNIIRFAINNIRDPHESLISRFLFLEGMKYGKAQQYMEKGYRKDIPAIQATTFAEKRRRAIKSITNSLLLNRTLDFVIIDYGRGRNKQGEIGLRLPNVD